MGISVIWDNEQKTIIRYIYNGRWTWEDLQNARSEARSMMALVSHEVDVIADVRQSSFLPSGTITRARQIVSSAPVNHNNEGITVIVGAAAFVRAMYDIIVKVFPDLARKHGLLLEGSLEDARSFITRYRLTQSSTPL